jgi:hypothetical protein
MRRRIRVRPHNIQGAENLRKMMAALEENHAK